MNTSIIILFIGIFLSVLIRTFFIINGLDVADVNKLHQIAEAILRRDNPYVLFNFTIYPPIGYYIETLVLFLSNFLTVPFHISTKILPNLADVIITIVLYKFLIKHNVKSISASLWGLIFILNPISIITSSAHGQLDSITSLLVLLSIYILTDNPTKFYKLLPALLLGLAIAIKPNPAMLLPFFLVCKKWKLKQSILFLSISLAPTVISLAPYMWRSPHEVIVNVFNYSGIYDLSYAAILRSFWYQQNADYWLPYSSELLNASKLAFGVGVSFLVILFAQSKNLIKACLAVYLLFLGVYFGISVQYLSWILPLAVLAREKMVISFSITGTLASLGFYTFFGPDILFGRYWNGMIFQSKYMLLYFLGNLALWITILWWLIKIIKGSTNEVFNNFSPLRKRMIIVSLILFIISLFPILRLSFIILSEAKITQ